MGLVYLGTTLELNAKTTAYENPNRANWKGFALGQPGFTSGTGITWNLHECLASCGQALDFDIFFFNNGSQVVANVTSASDTTTVLCTAQPTWDPATGYTVTIPTGTCPDIGRTAQAQASMTYATPFSTSSDTTPSTPTANTRFPAYWLVGATGVVNTFGVANFFGSVSTPEVTGFDSTSSRRGYWIVNAAGRVFAMGDAHWRGDAGPLLPGESVRSISGTPSTNGYWLFTNRGRVLAFGDAHFFGDMSHTALNGSIVGSATTPTGNGYYMVGSDGGIFTFGDARFRGSMGSARLNQPVIGLVPTHTNQGYWLVASDGGVFAFNAPFRGSMGSTPLNRPIVAMTHFGDGYLMVASDGGVFDFSNQYFSGSLGGRPPTIPIVGIAEAS